MKDWYKVIGCDNTVESPLVTDSSSLTVAPDELCICERVSGWSALSWLRAEDAEVGDSPDDVLQNDLGLPVFSSRTRVALERGSIDSIQYLPVRVFGPGKKEWKGFAIANILECRKALDFEHSDYDTYPEDYFLPDRRGELEALRRPVLKRDVIDDCDVFRLAEYRSGVFVSENFRSIFEKSGFTGYSFSRVEVRKPLARQSG